MRVLLKLSGEVLAWEKWMWYDSKTLKDISKIIKEIIDDWVELAIVVWWGNLIRWEEMQDFQLYYWHNMWLLTSSINAYWLEDYLTRVQWIKAVSLHSVQIDWIFTKFTKREADRILKKGQVLLLGWWTWLPFFTTDTWAVLRTIEIGADLMIKATKVNWIYTKDPVKHKDAELIEDLTYDEAIIKNLKVMDMTALALARDHDVKMKVVCLGEKWAIIKAIKWKKIWTTVKRDK